MYYKNAIINTTARKKKKEVYPGREVTVGAKGAEVGVGEMSAPGEG